jgi:hypothetical protein
VNLMLWQVKFHGVFKYQRDILSHRGRVSQVFVISIQFRSISHIVEAHWGLDYFGIVSYDILNRLLENEILIFL